VHLFGKLRTLLATYKKQEGTTDQGALRDSLTDLRHLADEQGLDFFKALDGSYEVYLQEKHDPCDPT
jgi:hypothetical protein